MAKHTSLSSISPTLSTAYILDVLIAFSPIHSDVTSDMIPCAKLKCDGYSGIENSAFIRLSNATLRACAVLPRHLTSRSADFLPDIAFIQVLTKRYYTDTNKHSAEVPLSEE